MWPLLGAAEAGQFLAPPRVPATGELRREPGREDLDRGLPGGDPRAERQDVGVVVLAGEPGGVGVGAGRRADAGQLVGRDRHAEPGAADEDTDRKSAV